MSGVIISLMPEKNQLRKNMDVIKYWRKDPKSIEKFQFIYHFIPHPEKRVKASFLQNKAIFLYCVLILLVTFAFRFIPQIAPGVLGYASNINISDLLKYTNRKREEAGASNLSLNARLSLAAEKKAHDMFEDGYWSHVAPDGKEPWDFIIAEGYDYIYAGENLAKNFSTSKEVVEAWYKSPSHKTNLIGTNYNEVGFAVVNGVMDGYETTLVVQMFGKTKQPSTVAAVYEGEDSIENSKVDLEESEPVKGTQVSNTEEKVEKDKIEKDLSLESEIPLGTKTTPFVDITTVTKSISLAFGGFVGSLLALDVWYTKKKGVSKFSGLSLAHIAMLIVVIASIWFVFKPGIII